MNKETAQIVDKGLELLKALAEKLGLTIEQVFPYFLRQQWIEAITSIIIIGGLGGVMLIVARILYTRKERSKDSDIRLACLIGMYVFGIAGSLVLAVTLATSIPQLLNPHYYAIRAILASVKP